MAATACARADVRRQLQASRALQKQLKTDHALAIKLWELGNHDARVLATMIADPAKLTSAIAEHWRKELDNYVLSDAFCGLVAKSPMAQRKAARWRASKREWTSSTGWTLTSRLARDDASIAEERLSELVEQIAADIHAAPNRTRHAMNQALIAIGVRTARLSKRALAAAKRIGKVEVDHGDTSCQTPDAAAYISKTLARRRKKAAR